MKLYLLNCQFPTFSDDFLCVIFFIISPQFFCSTGTINSSVSNTGIYLNLIKIKNDYIKDPLVRKIPPVHIFVETVIVAYLLIVNPLIVALVSFKIVELILKRRMVRLRSCQSYMSNFYNALLFIVVKNLKR